MSLDKRLRQIVIDLDPATGSFQGATKMNEVRVIEEGVEVGRLPMEAVPLAQEELERIMSASVSEHVKKCAQLEAQIDAERQEAMSALEALRREIASLQNQLSAENETNQQLTAKLAAASKALAG